MQYEPHSLCLAFPEMASDDYRRLRDSVKLNGLMVPIVLFEGKVLDGRHRLRACEETGVAPRFEQFPATGDAAQYVITHNLEHRHLTPTQIARVSLRFEAVERERAKARMAAGQPYTHMGIGSEPGATIAVLGSKFGVGANTVQRVITATKNGVPELATAMDSGEITANEAVEISKLQPKSQRRLVSLPKKERRKAMATAVAISRARKAPKTVQAGPAGTELTRSLLGRVELIANDLSSRGLKDRAMIVERFNAEFGWGDSVQLQQLWHCMPTLQMLGELYQLASRKSTGAAA